MISKGVRVGLGADDLSENHGSKACPDDVKKDGHFHLAPPNLNFLLWPRTDIEFPSNYAEFDSALDCIKKLF